CALPILEPYRAELHAHCYRMLGSLHDAEDAFQEASLRAWRALAKFEGRSSLRSWLYTIATNACLTAIERRPKRVLPIDYGPATDPHEAPGEPIVESVWMEPYPDERLGLQDGYAAPDARYELRQTEALREMVERYVDAWERCDVEAFAAMLAEDATFAMPPLASWYQGREGIATWAAGWPLSGAWRWRTVFTRANGQPALGFYAWDDD